MIKIWNFIKLSLFFIVALFLISCATSRFNSNDPYKGMETVNYSGNNIYLFSNGNSEKLIIIIESGGWDSALGIKKDDKWISLKFASIIVSELSDKYTVIIPEKLKRQPGMMYDEDMNDRANYTAENLLNDYIKSINGFLSSRNYSSILLIGNEEGASLLPLIYERMEKKENVIAMVSMGFGGLSLYETYEIFSKCDNIFPDEYIKAYNEMLNSYNPSNKTFPDAYAVDYYVYTQRWLKSFIHIRPYDHYKNIDIPILFIHGNKNLNIAVDSTMYIQENLPKKPFKYMYYKWGVQPQNKRELSVFIEEVTDWILAQYTVNR